MSVSEICRQHGISQLTFYSFKLIKYTFRSQLLDLFPIFTIFLDYHCSFVFRDSYF